MSWILKRFLEAGLIDGDTSVQLKTWGIDVPSVPEKAIRTRQDLAQFLEDLDTDLFRPDLEPIYKEPDPREEETPVDDFIPPEAMTLLAQMQKEERHDGRR